MSLKTEKYQYNFLVWASSFHLTKMRFSPHFYIDFTFIKPIGIKLSLIIL